MFVGALGFTPTRTSNVLRATPRRSSYRLRSSERPQDRRPLPLFSSTPEGEAEGDDT